MEWDHHKITKLIIHSELGGNCRLRLNQIVKNALLKNASGKNPNNCFTTTDVKRPIIHTADGKIATSKLPQTWIYDMQTKAGKSYRII
jgi:alpha-L-fucosidase 2